MNSQELNNDDQGVIIDDNQGIKCGRDGDDDNDALVRTGDHADDTEMNDDDDTPAPVDDEGSRYVVHQYGDDGDARVYPHHRPSTVNANVAYLDTLHDDKEEVLSYNDEDDEDDGPYYKLPPSSPPSSRDAHEDNDSGSGTSILYVLHCIMFICRFRFAKMKLNLEHDRIVSGIDLGSSSSSSSLCSSSLSRAPLLSSGRSPLHRTLMMRMASHTTSVSSVPMSPQSVPSPSPNRNRVHSAPVSSPSYSRTYFSTSTWPSRSAVLDRASKPRPPPPSSPPRVTYNPTVPNFSLNHKPEVRPPSAPNRSTPPRPVYAPSSSNSPSSPSRLSLSASMLTTKAKLKIMAL